MNKTLSKAVLTIVLSLAAASANANQIQLEFKVDVTSKSYGTNSINYYSPPISFNYLISINDESISNQLGEFPNGNKFSNVRFSSSNIPETQFTAEVLANNTNPLGQSSNAASLQREYIPNMYGDGQNRTFQAIFLNTNAQSPMNPTTNQTTSYQRGIGLQPLTVLGDTTTEFTSASFQAYMNTLIGNSSFSFNDTYLISEYYPETNSGNSIRSFGYWGNATLLSVTSIAAVPESDTSAMLLVGIGLLGFVERRRKAHKLK